MSLHRCLTLLFLLVASMPAAQAMHCAGAPPHTGDYDDDIAARCGDPFWADDQRAFEADGSAQQPGVHAARYTSWYYNFGSREPIVRLIFRDGRLEREQKLGRGVDNLGATCSLTRNAQGMSSGELVAHCGKPADHERDPDMIYPAHACTDYSHLDRTYGSAPPDCAQENEDDREIWEYDFGGAWVYVVRLVNGTVDDVRRERRR